MKGITLTYVTLVALMLAGNATAQEEIAPGATLPGEGTHLPIEFIVTQVGNTQFTKITFEGGFSGGGVHAIQPTAGATFSANSLILIDSDAGGTGNFANEPSPSTIAFWLSGGSISVTFDDLVSDVGLFYTSSVPASLQVFDVNGNLLSTINGGAQHNVGCTGDPFGSFCNWTPLSIDLGQNVIRSATFSGVANQTGFEDFTFSRISGFSNVAFLPGFKGSRLYTLGTFFEDELWIPNNRGDMCALRPRDDGSSEPGIYTRDIINSVPIVGDIYGDFVEFMDSLRTGGFLSDWAILPYDWRLDVERIARDGVTLGESGVTRVEDLIASIEGLASSSQTGKVTVITHSNGGLLAKELIGVLTEQGKAQLVDQIIMIAAPQLGTPEAVVRLLHGDGEGLALGLIVSETVAREAGETMVGAYNLLPSEEYFARVGSPVIEFDPDSTFSRLIEFRIIHGNQITAYGNDQAGFRGFLLGDGGRRAEPFVGPCINAPDDTREPNVLRLPLVERSRVLHVRSDPWQPPPGTEVVQLAGWGLPTMRGIEYTSELDNCSIIGCEEVLAHRRLDTTAGDGTVVIPSATALPVETFYFDVRNYNRGFTRNRDHASIMGAEPVRDLIRSLLEGDRDPSITHITKEQPIGANYVRVILRSPAVLHVFDSAGRHTGLVPSPDPESEFPSVEEQVPNSSFDRFGGDEYIILDTEDEYRIEIQGVALGTITLELEEYVDDERIAALRYIDIPVSADTRGQLTLQGLASASQLELDLQGDGVIDFVLNPAEQGDPIISLRILRTLIRELSLLFGVQESLTRKLEAAVVALEAGHRRPAVRILDALLNEIHAQSGKMIPSGVANSLVGITRKIVVSL